MTKKREMHLDPLETEYETAKPIKPPSPSDWDRFKKRDQDRKRGTIGVSREPLATDGTWHGAAPRPIEKDARYWRPKSII